MLPDSRGGFRVERRGNATPQLTRYRPGVADHEGDEFYLEFLVPRTGASRGRSGRLKNTLTVAGVVAQQLPHIELLTEDTWTVSVDGFQQAVRIPNAARYLAQKLLVLDQRAVTGKRPNDVRYCYDTLHCFGDALVELSALAASIRWSAAWKSVFGEDVSCSKMQTFSLEPRDSPMGWVVLSLAPLWPRRLRTASTSSLARSTHDACRRRAPCGIPYGLTAGETEVIAGAAVGKPPVGREESPSFTGQDAG